VVGWWFEGVCDVMDAASGVWAALLRCWLTGGRAWMDGWMVIDIESISSMVLKGGHSLLVV